jgi:hypothetical protein
MIAPTRKVLFLTLFAAAGPLSACSSASLKKSEPVDAAQPATRSSWHAPGAALPGVRADCTAWSSVVDGPYKYENNVWGSSKAKGKFQQCLLEREVAGRPERGWTWNFPGFDPSVFAYPQILFGWKPWSGGKPTDARFPMRVADARHITLHYQVETEAEGSYNLAPEIWLIENGQWSVAANPKLITAEVMFWMDYKSGARPAGTIVDTPQLDGVTYELWKADEIGDKGDGKGWVLYSFKSPTVQHQGTISVDQLLDHLVRAGHVDPNHYVASVEFGNEVMGGSGTTWIKRFEVEVR